MKQNSKYISSSGNPFENQIPIENFSYIITFIKISSFIGTFRDLCTVRINCAKDKKWSNHSQTWFNVEKHELWRKLSIKICYKQWKPVVLAYKVMTHVGLRPLDRAVVLPDWLTVPVWCKTCTLLLIYSPGRYWPKKNGHIYCPFFCVTLVIN